MTPSPAPSSSFVRALSALMLGVIVIYLAQWLLLPLYPDEVAFRFYSARAGIDGWMQYGLFPHCPSNAHIIPWLLRPGATALAAFDAHMGWTGLRTLPMMVVLALAGSVIAHARRTTALSMVLFCSAFVGVAGGGLMLSRPEIIAAAHLLVCLLTFAAAAHRPAPIAVMALIIFHLLVISLSLVAHLQGLLLLPLSLLSLWRLLDKQRFAAFATTFMIGVAAWQSVGYWQFTCSEQPQFEQIIHTNRGSATPLIESDHFVTRNWERGVRYLRQFSYKEHFNPNYLPPVTALPARALNIPIWLVIIGNTAAFIAIMLAGLRSLWQRYRSQLRISQWRSTWQQILWDPWIALTGSALVLSAYAITDISGAFYRTIFTNLLAALIVAWGASLVTSTRLRRCLEWLGWAALGVCIASTLVNALYVVKPLREGFVGMSVSLATDWEKTANDVATLKKKCAIADDASRVVADDLSYQALRTHPNLIDFIYIYTDEIILRARYDEATRAERLKKLRSIKSSGVIARCASFKEFQLPIAARSGELCCIKP